MPDTAAAFFLEEAYIRSACADLELPAEVATHATASARAMAHNAALHAAALQAHEALSHGRRTIVCADLDPLPDAPLYYLVVLLSALPRLRELHVERGIPPAITAATLGDIALQLHSYHGKHGAWGLDPLIARWLAHHLCGQLYQLGRLQFMFARWSFGHRVYRHNATSHIIMLAGPGDSYRDDGQLNGAGGVTHAGGLWETVLYESAAQVCGHPIDAATGSTLARLECLNLKEWCPVMTPGELYLDIHIPAGAPLDPAACHDSLCQAARFFPRYFPEQPFRALVCVSWLCDAQFENWLAPHSNIVRWLREFYLFPVSSDAWSGIRSVFGCDIEYDWQGQLDLAPLPRQTSLQRALLLHLEQRGHWRKAGALLMVDDLPGWGTGTYRKA